MEAVDIQLRGEFWDRRSSEADARLRAAECHAVALEGVFRRHHDEFAQLSGTLANFARAVRREFDRRADATNRWQSWIDALLLRPIARLLRDPVASGGAHKIAWILNVAYLAFAALNFLWLLAFPWVVAMYGLFKLAQFQQRQVYKQLARDYAAGLRDLRLVYFVRETPFSKFPFESIELVSTESDHPERTLTRSWQVDRPDEHPLTGPVFLSCESAREAFALLRVPEGRVSHRLIFQNAENGLVRRAGALLGAAIDRHVATLTPVVGHFRELAIESDKVKAAHRAFEIARQSLEGIHRIQNVWNRIVLGDNALAELIQRIDLYCFNPDHLPSPLLIVGGSGMGKTLLGEVLRGSCEGTFLKIAARDLNEGGRDPAERVRHLWETALAPSQRAILFIDDLDQLLAAGKESDRSLVDAFRHGWDRADLAQNVWVVATARDPTRVPADTLARFGARVELSLPDARGRKRLIAATLVQIRRTEDVTDELVAVCHDLSCHEIVMVTRQAAERAGFGQLTAAHFRQALGVNQSRVSQGMEMTSAWATLVLDPATKIRLQTIAHQLMQAETFTRQGFSVPRALLLYGAPGTGKTEIARTIANVSRLTFIAVTTADLKASYLGQSAQRVKDVFARARSAGPAILFIDEIESVAAARGSTGADQFTNEIVTQLLQEMEGILQPTARVYVMAATNLPENIDPALLSRFSERLEIPLPGEPERAALLRNFLNKIKKLDFDLDTGARDLAKKFPGFSGRDLRNLVEKAQGRAVTRAIANGSANGVVLKLDDLFQANDRKEVSAADFARIWEEIVLPAKIAASLLRQVQLFNANDPAAPRGLLLFGPPGTGKTLIAKKIAESANCEFLPLSLPDLKAGYVGQSGQKVRKIWDRARSAGKAVLFIDECEGIFARRGGTDGDALTVEIVQAFLAEWDGVASKGQIWVVGATNRRELLDEAIVQRFGSTVEIHNPDAAARAKIIALELKKIGLPVEVPALAGAGTAGFSGRMLAQVARKIREKCDQPPVPSKVFEDVVQEMRRVSSDTTSGDATWDRLIVSSALKRRLQEMCELLRGTETLRERGIGAPTGLLLFGPPGTGKTEIARTLARESGLTFLSATTAELKAGYTGQSGANVKTLFGRARAAAPCILFLDELESVSPARGSPNADTFTNEIVTQLLQEMDGVKRQTATVFVLAATNLPEQIDSAVGSRFAEKIEVPLPGEDERYAILAQRLEKIPSEQGKPDWIRQVAQATDGKSGRDLTAIADQIQQRAALRAIHNHAPDKVELMLGDFWDFT